MRGPRGGARLAPPHPAGPRTGPGKDKGGRPEGSTRTVQPRSSPKQTTAISTIAAEVTPTIGQARHPPFIGGPDALSDPPPRWALVLARAPAGAAAVLGRRDAEADDVAAEAVLGILAGGRGLDMPAWFVLHHAQSLGRRRAFDLPRRRRGRRSGADRRVDPLLRSATLDLDAACHIADPALDREAALLNREREAARERALACVAGLPAAQRRAVCDRLAGQALNAAGRQAHHAAVGRLRRAMAVATPDLRLPFPS